MVYSINETFDVGKVFGVFMIFILSKLEDHVNHLYPILHSLINHFYLVIPSIRSEVCFLLIWVSITWARLSSDRRLASEAR